MWLSGLVEARLLASLPPGPLVVAAVASVCEELAKLAVVAAVALLVRREFDDPMDGIVYGSMAGLGAAVEESLFYRGLAPELHVFLPAAELVRLWAHVVLGGIVGFPLGFWRASRGRAAYAASVGLALAVGLHFGWDWIVLAVPPGTRPGASSTAAGVMLMLASLGLYGRMVVVASARSRRQLAPGSPLRLWGWPFDRSRRADDARAASAD